MPKLLEFTEGEAFVYEVTVRRRGTGDAVNLDAYDVVTLQIHDAQDAFGTNDVSINGTKDPDQATNTGLVRVTFATTNTQMAAGKTDFFGHWSVLCKTNDNSLSERSARGECVIHRNPFAAV